MYATVKASKCVAPLILEKYVILKPWEKIDLSENSMFFMSEIFIINFLDEKGTDVFIV